MNYHDVIYRNYKQSTYPEKLAKHLVDKHLNNCYSILDVGSGDNSYVNAFKDLHLESEGLNKGCNFEKDKLPYSELTFDCVFTKSVIEHVLNTEHFLKELHRVAFKKVIILTPAWEYNYRDFYNDPTHIKPFHRKGMRDALLLAGFKNVKVDYFYHLPFMWDRSYLTFIPKFLSLFSNWKWKDDEQTKHRVLLRFSQEVQLLAIGEK